MSYPRGVYHLPCTMPDGSVKLLAVNRWGVCIAEATSIRTDDLNSVAEKLWQQLDDDDPVPSLRVV